MTLELNRQFSTEVINAYQTAFRRIGDIYAAKRFWDRCLEEFERENLGGDFLNAIATYKNVVGFLLALKPDLTGEQAVLEIAFALGFLTQIDRNWLVREIVDNSLLQQLNDRPEWNRNRGELMFQGDVIRKVRVDIGTNIVQILDEFELEGWPERVDSPFTDDVTHRETIRTLNERLRAIHFDSDGTGRGILWQLMSPPTV